MGHCLIRSALIIFYPAWWWVLFTTQEFSSFLMSHRFICANGMKDAAELLFTISYGVLNTWKYCPRSKNYWKLISIAHTHKKFKVFTSHVHWVSQLVIFWKCEIRGNVLRHPVLSSFILLIDKLLPSWYFTVLFVQME